MGSASTSGLVSITDGTQILEIGCQNTTGTPANAVNGTLALFRYSATHMSAAQIRAAYAAEKPMFVASAECLLQSGSTDAVLDVDVDPLTGKVLVTQTDAITIFDGLAVDSKPTVNAGASEKGKLWGDLRAEQNDTNAYVTAPAVDQRQVNEMVRGLASDLPAGPDLSKASAWIHLTPGTTIDSSFNVKKVVESSAGRYEVHFGVPFKTDDFAAAVTAWHTGVLVGMINYSATTQFIGKVECRNVSDSAAQPNQITAVFYGELEDE
jgi:hypothetical protein